MKKTFVLGILLAIASMTVSFASNWKTVTLPFAEQTDVNALLAYSDHYIAFGNVGQALTAYYDSNNTTPVIYTAGMADQFSRVSARNAYKIDKMSIILGDTSLFATSIDSGKTWKNYDFGALGNQVLAADSFYIYLFDVAGTGCRFGRSNLKGRAFMYWDNPQPTTAPITTFRGKNGAGIVMSNSIGSSCFSLESTLTEKKFSSDDVIVSAISDSIVSMLAVSENGSYSLYKFDGKELLGKVAINNIMAGDYGFIPYGCLSLNGTGYFIGLNKEGQAIKVGLDNSREIIDVEIIPTCLATTGDTLLIGGKNGKIAMLDKLTTSLKPVAKQKSNILVRNGNTTFITGEGKNISWTVISMLGKVVGSGNGQEINLAVSPGMYIVRMKIDKETIVQKTIF